MTVVRSDPPKRTREGVGYATQPEVAEAINTAKSDPGVWYQWGTTWAKTVPVGLRKAFKDAGLATRTAVVDGTVGLWLRSEG